MLSMAENNRDCFKKVPLVKNPLYIESKRTKGRCNFRKSKNPYIKAGKGTSSQNWVNKALIEKMKKVLQSFIFFIYSGCDGKM